MHMPTPSLLAAKSIGLLVVFEVSSNDSKSGASGVAVLAVEYT
jgi:hypothetical protein